MKKGTKPLPHYLQDFLDWLEVEKGLSSKSQENYSRFLKKFFNWLKINNLEDIKTHELTPQHIWKYRLYLSRHSFTHYRQPLKKTTQNYYLIALRNLLNYFAERDIQSLPAEKIKLAKSKEERQIRFLTLDQLNKLLSVPNVSTLTGIRDRAIIETFFSTGMRIAELVALNRNQIKIQKAMKVLELSIIGKGGRVRTVYFSERALYWLGRYLERRRDAEKALFVNHLSRGYENRLTPRSIEKMIQKYALKAGIPSSTTPHVMRHTFATDLLNQGVDLRTIQEFLGHKSIAATQIYAHVTNQQLREVHIKFHSGRRLSAQ